VKHVEDNEQWLEQGSPAGSRLAERAVATVIDAWMKKRERR
jgi:hypothetical protein